MLQEKQLSAVFQPIIDLRRQTFLGYEGLIRGPDNLSPYALLEAAKHQGRLAELEKACLHTLLQRYAELSLPGKLFLNCSADVFGKILDSEFANVLQAYSVPAGTVVFELTEHSAFDTPNLQQTVNKAHNLGFQIALDDLGEGFSNLKIWSLIHPDYVKIDRHFTQGVAKDRLKYEFIHAITLLANAVSSSIIAEGVETQEDLSVLLSLDIPYAQGFLFAYPSPTPELSPSSEIVRWLRKNQPAAFSLSPLNGYPQTMAELVDPIPPALPETSNDAILTRFERHSNLRLLPVVTKNQSVIGVIWRHAFIDNFVRPYRKEIYGKKPCVLFMDPNPLILEVGTPIHEAALKLADVWQSNDNLGLILTRQGKYVGACYGYQLLAKITQLQIESARYANPLTQLPGNVPIYTHMDRWLKKGSPFTVCYLDIDHFKPFNDVYGYHAGDRLICALAQHLLAITERPRDFVGHIGGDDFIVLFQSSDWQTRIQQLFVYFDRTLSELLTPEHLDQKGYFSESRTGQMVFHPLPSLSIGAVIASTNCYPSYQSLADAASQAKRLAKKQSGHSLFLERRNRPL
ncbi:MAG: GGDEF domain-containing protein [Methylohalobius sp.]